MKRIILTGGGTAGHVTPNMALMPELKKHGYDIQYIGSYHGIASGKLRRYFSMKNFSDPFKVLKGISEAKKLMKELKPDVVFSKGGFVTVSVVFAAHSAGIPVVIHESDMTPGLANKLALPKATKVCCNFPETKDLFPEGKAVVTGTPIVGGSSGSVIINNAIRDNIDRLLEIFNVIHLCGKDNLDESLNDKKGYVQYEYVKKELASMLALCDIIISRAGANAICELLALRKPNILIPLSKAASRGDQILNAQSFEKSGYSYVIQEEELNTDSLFAGINEVYNNKEKYIQAMESSNLTDSTGIIINMIEDLVNSHD